MSSTMENMPRTAHGGKAHMVLLMMGAGPSDTGRVRARGELD